MRHSLSVMSLAPLLSLPWAASFHLSMGTPNTENQNEQRKLQKEQYLFSPGGLDRREIIQLAPFSILAVPLPAAAGEVGARITKAVTTSDLGVSVRTSVVKGAQTMDKIDGMWENFSDRYGLGTERSKAGKRPTPKVIPPLLPLDVATARTILQISDQSFSSVTGIPLSIVEEKVKKYNFVVYCHFKAYSDLVVERQIPFSAFRSNFEKQVGHELVAKLLPGSRMSREVSKKDKFNASLATVDSLCRILREKGLVAAAEIDTVDDDKVSDWIDDISDLEFNIALDGDVTLNAQVLLQEQGFRLYPNFSRYAINEIMSQVDERQKVTTMDYYFDTDYNSDPDKFEVKEVLLSVSLENP